MSMIKVSNLTFSYDGGPDVFKDTSFTIDTDWKLGFTGRNGRGKTTFLNLLLGRYPYQGTIRSSVDFECFPYAVSNEEELAIEVMKSKCPRAEDFELLREVGHLDLDFECLYRPFKTLSGGQKSKVLLASLFCGEEKFLLIDEPTNHLDLAARHQVGEYLAKKKGFILVSHDRELLDSCVDHILSIERTKIVIQKGNFSTWLENRQMSEQREREENEKLQRQISSLEEATSRTAKWADRVESTKNGTRNSGLRPDKGYIGHQAAKMMQRAKNTKRRAEDAAAEKKRLLLDVEVNESLKMNYQPSAKKTLLRLEDIAINYGDQTVIKGFSLQVDRGERISLRGKNGGGKSSILKLILGELKPSSGKVALSEGLVISYVRQDTATLSGTLPELVEEHQIEASLFHAVLIKLGFDRELFYQRIECLSEGQKKKVLLAASLAGKANIYIWDEPLNYVDIIARLQIEAAISTYSPTMIFVEHDAQFERNTATRIIEINQL